jgi:hypothetical protein
MAAGLARLPEVTLAELDAEAALLRRRERKYVVPFAVAERLLGGLDGRAHALVIAGRHVFRFESVYFDTPDRASYLLAEHRRPWRYKLRTRSYLDSGRCVLELKTRDGRGRTFKARRSHHIERRGLLEVDERGLVAAHPLIGSSVGLLVPALITGYARANLLLREERARTTLDADLRAHIPTGSVAAMPGMVIVETKTPGAPCAADRFLWSMGYRPVRMSKFGTSLAALLPGLPANRWTRALILPWAIGTGVDLFH